MSPRARHRLSFLSFAAISSACGGSGVAPTPVPTPQVVTHPATFVAFLDENENGLFEGSEGTRIPGAEITVGTVKGTSAALTGQVVLQVPDGSQSLSVTAASLPPFYRPPGVIAFTAPATSPIMVPITLPRGTNRANVYMAFGDSITNGEPRVGDGNGYRRILEDMLGAHFGSAEVANEGRDATQTSFGAEIIGTRLAAVRPSFTLIHYGTNDWYLSECRELPCSTTRDLRFMVQQINRSRGHAFLATILPSNTGYDDRAPASRNEWVAAQNVFIKQIAEEEGAVLVDLNGAFLKSGQPLSSLFVDHVHPTAVGYQIMAQTWFDAITKAYSKILADF